MYSVNVEFSDHNEDSGYIDCSLSQAVNIFNNVIQEIRIKKLSCVVNLYDGIDKIRTKSFN